MSARALEIEIVRPRGGAGYDLLCPGAGLFGIREQTLSGTGAWSRGLREILDQIRSNPANRPSCLHIRAPGDLLGQLLLRGGTDLVAREFLDLLTKGRPVPILVSTGDRIPEDAVPSSTEGVWRGYYMGEGNRRELDSALRRMGAEFSMLPVPPPRDAVMGLEPPPVLLVTRHRVSGCGAPMDLWLSQSGVGCRLSDGRGFLACLPGDRGLPNDHRGFSDLLFQVQAIVFSSRLTDVPGIGDVVRKYEDGGFYLCPDLRGEEAGPGGAGCRAAMERAFQSGGDGPGADPDPERVSPPGFSDEAFARVLSDSGSSPLI